MIVCSNFLATNLHLSNNGLGYHRPCYKRGTAYQVRNGMNRTVLCASWRHLSSLCSFLQAVLVNRFVFTSAWYVSGSCIFMTLKKPINLKFVNTTRSSLTYTSELPGILHWHVYVTCLTEQLHVNCSRLNQFSHISVFQ